MLRGFFRWEFARLIVGLLKDARFFFWFLELPPGDVCPREKTSEEPPGDVCPRGGNPRDGRSGIFPERGVGRAKYVKGRIYAKALRVFSIS